MSSREEYNGVERVLLCPHCSAKNRVKLEAVQRARCGICHEPLSDSLYQVLGVSASAGMPEIKRAYHKQILVWHPDRHAGDELAAKRFQALQEAYRILSHPERRASYDLARQAEMENWAKASRSFEHMKKEADGKKGSTQNPLPPKNHHHETPIDSWDVQTSIGFGSVTYGLLFLGAGILLFIIWASLRTSSSWDVSWILWTSAVLGGIGILRILLFLWDEWSNQDPSSKSRG